MEFSIKDKFRTELSADPSRHNMPRQVFDACFSYVRPRIPTSPRLVHVSKEMAIELGIDMDDISSDEFLKVFSGAKVMQHTDPYAMCYGGHQFGHWAGQLGDGRAINLAEVEHEGKSWTLQLKGAGETPYSRRADGLAVLRSSIREHLCSEAMYHLGVPTTRSLSLMLTGDEVLRDIMYDGNSDYEKGAVVCRVAPTFIRFGNFEIFASRKDNKNLKELTDFTIRHYFPDVEEGTKEGYIEFFRQVAQRTLKMIVEWQRVGFVHGVMNTDNMSILGLTIDYGPYGWLEGYDPNWTPNTTDRQGKRYRFDYQPGIGLWNLAQLANALYPLIEDSQPLQDVLDHYQRQFPIEYFKMMNQKLGLRKIGNSNKSLIAELQDLLPLTETDMTIFFRNLSNLSKDELVDEKRISTLIGDAFYSPEEVKEQVLERWILWLLDYQRHLQNEEMSDTERHVEMNKVNPKYVLRNYMAQMAIDAADNGDYSIIDELNMMLKRPYDKQSEYQKWFAKRPEWARHKVGCSMLSCSS